MRRYIAIALLFVCGLALAAEARKAIPKEFLGYWGNNSMSCQDLRVDLRAIRIEPQRINRFVNSSEDEISGKVLAVATSGKLELAVILEFRGGGETWIEARQFLLSADMNTMTDITGRQDGMVFKRCNKTSQK